VTNFDIVPGSACTIFRAKGDLSRDDFIVAITTHFPHLPSANIIWDITAASMSKINQTDIRKIIATAKVQSRKRDGAKTAFVGSTNETFALGCIYVALAAISEIAAQYYAFHALEPAELWMNGYTIGM
jgi:glucose-6-phosphate 1-dehydrogenase